MLKKDSSLSEDVSTSDLFSVGEDVIVLNHGNHWEYRGEIVSIDSENDTAMIRWETTRKIESVDVKDLKKYSVSEKSLRKRKPTEFFFHNKIRNFPMRTCPQRMRSKTNFIHITIPQNYVLKDH